ncbi:MAG TPA: YncE family protein [Geobacteraceae bacterium]|nr:YncE family protein [Geobacteraceae bacterium]
MKGGRLLALVMSCLLLSSVVFFSGCGGDTSSSSLTSGSNSSSSASLGGATGGTSGATASTTTTTANPLDALFLGRNFGVVALSSGGIGILNGTTLGAVSPLLVGELGSVGGGLFDVVISPDGKTTLVSNFGDSTVFLIDTTYPAMPSVVGSIDVGFFAEDMDITPDGRYALVTDGGFSTKIAVIDVRNRSLARVAEFSWLRQFQSVSISSDGATVLAADYWNGQVHALLLDQDGKLEYVSSMDISKDGKLRPVNVAISPDGHTAIVVCVGDSDYMAVPVLFIPSPGQVKISRYLSPGTHIVGAQSVVFNRAGTKAYMHCVQAMPDVVDATASVVKPIPVEPNNVIMVMNVAPGLATEDGTPFEVNFTGRYQLFGVDTLAMDYQTGYLYVSNPVLSDGKNYVQVVDVNSRSVIKTIGFGTYYDSYDKEQDTLPAGVAFWNPKSH